MINRIELLKLVEHNARIKIEDLAVMLNASSEELSPNKVTDDRAV